MKQPGATNIATHPRRARALELMLSGASDREIARELGCDHTTVWRWRREPSLAAELREAQRERLLVMRDRVLALVPRALDLIGELMGDESQPAAVRLRAAEAALDRAGWAGRAQERRVSEAISAEVESFMKLLADHLPQEQIQRLVEIINKPWPDAKPKDAPRRAARVSVEFPQDDEEDLPA